MTYQSPTILGDQEFSIMDDADFSPTARQILLSGHLAMLHQATNLSIWISPEKISHYDSRYKPIPAVACLASPEGRNCTVQTPCFVAGGNKLFQLLKKTQSKIDLMEHLDDLLPRSGRGIGLVTCQNGIQNSINDFEDMCRSILDKLALEKPLFIGLYNKTHGKIVNIKSDLFRLKNEWVLNPISSLTLRQLFYTMGKRLSDIRPYMSWLHIAHSEGVRIAYNCLSKSEWGLANQSSRTLQRQLIIASYGGLDVIRNSQVKQAINNYSVKDITFHFFASQYITKKVPKPEDMAQPLREEWKEKEQIKSEEYPYPFVYRNLNEEILITLLKSTSRSTPKLEGDHGFLDSTYQNALKSNFDIFRNRGPGFIQ